MTTRRLLETRRPPLAGCAAMQAPAIASALRS
jgi:hypothetical protein